MEEKSYIRPSKESPVFVAGCDYFGSIDLTTYKDYLIETNHGPMVGRTFAIRYADAVNRLHSYIKYNPEVIKSYPKCKFEIEIIDGSIDKFNNPIRKTVYKISAKKAKQLIIIS